MSILNVNQIQPVGSGQTVTISAANITASSATITANTFSGALSSSGISTFSDTVNVGAGKSIRLYGASSGYSEIVAAAGSASTTFTLPANGGSASQYLQTNGAGVLSWATVSTSNLTRGTEVATTSGTSFDFTGLPSTVRILTILLDNVSTNGTSFLQIQIGDSGGIETTGYSSFSGFTYQTGYGGISHTSGFVTQWASTAGDRRGAISLFNMSGNKWICQGLHSGQDGVNVGTVQVAGSKTLTDTLTQVRITTVNGTDTFDQGSINIFYEV